MNNFFNPRTVAIIGASDHVEKVGGILLKKALASKLEVIPINISHDSLFGKKCFKSVLDYSGNIDLAVIAIPAEFVVKALEECGKKDIKNVVLISAGFSEVNNKKGVEDIVKIADKYGIRFLGSNCFGTCNPSKNLDLTFANSMSREGDIAFISQSGALWSYIADLKDVGVSSFVSLGNMENMDFDDFIEYFGKDGMTKSIVLYVEKLKNGKRFLEVCKRAIKNGKRIYAIKGGSSDAGEKAAISHTASLASDYAIYKGAFRQAGVEMCENFLEMFERASGRKMNIKSKGVKIGRSAFIITNAGGAGVLLSDYLTRRNIKIVDKSLDIIGTALAEDYMRNFNEIKNKPFETLFVILTPQSMSEMEKTADKIVSMKKELVRMKKNVVAVFLGDKSMKEANKIFEKNDVEFVNGFGEI